MISLMQDTQGAHPSTHAWLLPTRIFAPGQTFILGSERKGAGHLYLRPCEMLTASWALMLRAPRPHRPCCGPSPLCPLVLRTFSNVAAGALSTGTRSMCSSLRAEHVAFETGQCH